MLNYHPNKPNYIFKTEQKQETVEVIKSLPINSVDTPYLPNVYTCKEIIKFIDILLFEYKNIESPDINDLMIYSKLFGMLNHQSNNSKIAEAMYKTKTYVLLIYIIGNYIKLFFIIFTI